MPSPTYTEAMAEMEIDMLIARPPTNGLDSYMRMAETSAYELRYRNHSNFYK